MEYLQHIFDTDPNGLLLFGPGKVSAEWTCIMENKAAIELLGISDTKGMLLHDLLPDAVASNLALADPKHAEHNAHDFYLDDHKRWILAAANNTNGLLTVSLTDITRLKEASFENRRLMRFYQSLSSNLADNEIILFDKELNVLFSEGTPRFIRVGVDGDLMGKNLSKLFETNQFTFLGEYVGKVFGGERADIEREVNGRFYRASVYSDKFDDDGHTGNMIGVLLLKDVSELNKKQRELELRMQQLDRSNRELQQFAYVASHDLQEPLRKIMSFGERLTRKYGAVLTFEGLEYITRMNNAAQRMETLINDLLSFSRATRSDHPFLPTDLNLIFADVISDMDAIERSEAKVDLNGEFPIIEAIPSQMRQLFQNLLNNALKFSHADRLPHVELRCSLAAGTDLPENLALLPEKNYCIIEVKDNGIGFEQTNAERIFVIFQRLHGRSEYSGTGVGLAIAKKIVDNHQGVIFAEGDAGKGALFTVILPLHQ